MIAHQTLALTLAITTYNRAQELKRALDSIAQLACPAHYQTEILVINNNSSDQTASMLEQIVVKWNKPQIRVIFESRQGLSHARNRALTEARGEWIAYMDDDQEISPDYLIEFARAQRLTSAQCIGGRIIYRLNQPLPAWLPPLIRTVGQLDLGDKTRKLQAPPQFLKGGNIAFHCATLRRVGGFDTRLGRNGQSLLAGEEDDVQLRIVAQGGSVEYWHGLLQYNHLPDCKLRKSYWRRHFFHYGRTQRLRSHDTTQFPPWLFNRLSQAIFAWINAQLRRDTNAFEKELDIWEILGALRR